MFPKLCTHYNDLFGCEISQIVQKNDIYCMSYLAVMFSKLCKQIMLRLVWLWCFLDYVNK